MYEISVHYKLTRLLVFILNFFFFFFSSIKGSLCDMFVFNSIDIGLLLLNLSENRVVSLYICVYFFLI